MLPVNRVACDETEVRIVDAFHFELIPHVHPAPLTMRVGFTRTGLIRLMGQIAEVLNETDDCIARIEQQRQDEASQPGPDMDAL